MAGASYPESSLHGLEQPGHLCIAVCISLSVVFFILINKAWKWLSQHYFTLAMTSQWRWRNLAVSWVHADLCAVGCFYCYFTYGHRIQSLPELLDRDLSPAYHLVSFSTGYFLYDMLNHFWNGQMRAEWEVIAHHIAVITIFGYHLLYQTYVSFSVLALTVEVNSVFLHGRKLLQMLHVPFSHWFYRLVSTFNLVSFLLFRCSPLVLIWATLILHPNRFSVAYWCMLSTVMTFMVILNSILFWRLLKNDVFRKPRPARKEGQNGKGKVDGEALLRVDWKERKKVAESQMNGNGCVQNDEVKRK